MSQQWLACTTKSQLSFLSSCWSPSKAGLGAAFDLAPRQPDHTPKVNAFRYWLNVLPCDPKGKGNFLDTKPAHLKAATACKSSNSCAASSSAKSSK